MAPVRGLFSFFLDHIFKGTRVVSDMGSDLLDITLRTEFEYVHHRVRFSDDVWRVDGILKPDVSSGVSRDNAERRVFVRVIPRASRDDWRPKWCFREAYALGRLEDHAGVIVPRLVKHREIEQGAYTVTEGLSGVSVAVARSLGQEIDSYSFGFQVGGMLARVHEVRMPRFGYHDPDKQYTQGWKNLVRYRTSSALGEMNGHLHPALKRDVRRIIDRVELPEREPRLLHHDVHEGNLLQRWGTLTGMVDWTHSTGGDPESDLALAFDERSDRYRAGIMTGYQETASLDGGFDGRAAVYQLVEHTCSLARLDATDDEFMQRYEREHSAIERLVPVCRRQLGVWDRLVLFLGGLLPGTERLNDVKATDAA